MFREVRLGHLTVSTDHGEKTENNKDTFLARLHVHLIAPEWLPSRFHLYLYLFSSNSHNHIQRGHWMAFPCLSVFPCRFEQEGKCFRMASLSTNGLVPKMRITATSMETWRPATS